MLRGSSPSLSVPCAVALIHKWLYLLLGPWSLALMNTITQGSTSGEFIPATFYVLLSGVGQLEIDEVE